MKNHRYTIVIDGGVNAGRVELHEDRARETPVAAAVTSRRRGRGKRQVEQLSGGPVHLGLGARYLLVVNVRIFVLFIFFQGDRFLVFSQGGEVQV